MDDRRIHRIVLVSHSHRDAYRIYPTFRRFEMIYSGCDLDLLNESQPPSHEKELVIFLGARAILAIVQPLIDSPPWKFVGMTVRDLRQRILAPALRRSGRL